MTSGALLGLLIGALLSATGFMLKADYESRKLLKQALFNLLEIWHRVYRLTNLTNDQVAQMYLDGLRRRVPELFSPEHEPQIAALVQGVLQKAPQDPPDDSLSARYQEAVIKTSSVDPVLASRLFGNELLAQRLGAIDQLITSIQEAAGPIGDAPEEKQFKERFDARLRKFAYSEALQLLKADVIELAGATALPFCRRVEEKRTRKWIDELPEQIRVAIQSGADRYIEQVLAPTLRELRQAN